MRERFIDDVKIFVRGGDGGDGCVSTRREKGVPHGGPDGGNGGHGGNVVLLVSSEENDLTSFKFKAHFKADRGSHGSGGNKEGKSAQDLIVKVPPGTIVYDSGTGNPIADMVEEDQSFTAAKGGRGGRGNAAFSNSVNRVPRFRERGQAGQERWIRLVLKILADVGIIGFPNAGKSSLLSKITAANPKIAPYPFTTISPNLGVSQKNGEAIVFADVPGLIEGAHKGLGLGQVFLKHIERTRILLHMIDVSAEEFRNDPLKYYNKLKNELALYNDVLIMRPEVVVLNKSDLFDDKSEFERILKLFENNGHELFVISCETGEGLAPLLERLFELVKTVPYVEETVTVEDSLPPLAVDFDVKKMNDYYAVNGAMIEQLVKRMDLDNYDAVSYLQRRLKRLGVEDALLKAGAIEGDIVVIGENEFDFSPGL